MAQPMIQQQPLPLPLGEQVATADARILIRNVTWQAFEFFLALKGDASAPRVAYLDGVLELMSPSKNHERYKSYVGSLVETYAVERGIELSAYGGWTLKGAPTEAGIEPDECFVFGEDQRKDVPDLAIEVVWTSGGLKKLEIYRRLGVFEVWQWKDGVIAIYLLDRGEYRASPKSHWLPGLNLAMLSAFLEYPTVTSAIRGYRAALAVKAGAATRRKKRG